MFDDNVLKARYPAGSFYSGLGRPWMGFCALDTVCRDAVRGRLGVHAANYDDFGTVVVEKRAPKTRSLELPMKSIWPTTSSGPCSSILGGRISPGSVGCRSSTSRKLWKTRKNSVSGHGGFGKRIDQRFSRHRMVVRAVSKVTALCHCSCVVRSNVGCAGFGVSSAERLFAKRRYSTRNLG